MLKRFLTSKETAGYLGITEEELNDLVNKAVIPVYKIGGIYTRFKVDDLEAHRRKDVTTYGKKRFSNIIDTLKDFFYFNDFYILSVVVIIAILYFIFK